MKVESTEEGYDFITLYFENAKDMNAYSKALYRLFNGIAKFAYQDLQRSNFRHLPGDIPHFHPEVEAKSPHFHIIYPHRPTKEDWDFLYLWGNRNTLELPKD